jgi:hypothetical protein
MDSSPGELENWYERTNKRDGLRFAFVWPLATPRLYPNKLKLELMEMDLPVVLLK